MRNPALQRRIDKLFNPAVMGLLALAIVPLLLLDLSAKLTPTGSTVTTVLDWVVIAVFAAEYGARLSIAESKVHFVISPWHLLDLVVVLTPFVGLGVRAAVGASNSVLTASPLLRLLRFARLFALAGKSFKELKLHRTLAQNYFYHVAAGTLVVFFVISSVFFVVENTPRHPLTFGDVLWWGWGALSTIGSEIIPSSGMGRVLGFVLMIMGLAFAGFFTANVVSYFQEFRGSKKGNGSEGDASSLSSDNHPVLHDLLERQQRIEAKLDQLLAQKKEDGLGENSPE
ncbi:MAG: ion transporter [Chloroflexi bacterium]|nr:ion transporter [Chloroflexota bacterium]